MDINQWKFLLTLRPTSAAAHFHWDQFAYQYRVDYVYFCPFSERCLFAKESLLGWVKNADFEPKIEIVWFYDFFFGALWIHHKMKKSFSKFTIKSPHFILLLLPFLSVIFYLKTLLKCGFSYSSFLRRYMRMLQRT